MSATDSLALVGTTVSDKYEIERVVGEGGFALVYRATHKVWKRPVAIKVFRALGDLPHAQRDQLVHEFIREGALLAELSERSAAICQARDVGMLKSGGREMPYMVLEWLEGESLDTVLTRERQAKRPPRTPIEALHLLEPAAEALALAHRKGIAHRDVKPGNIFILGDPRGDFTVKLLDFGIAKVVQDAQRMGGAFAQTQGVVSSFTPSYGAPEQFSRTHGATGPWTDVFAMALIFTELCTQQRALQGDDLTQLAFCSMDPTRRPTPRTFGVEISDGLEAVLRRAVAVSPDERYASMGELWDALRGALSMTPLRMLSGPETPRGASGPGQGELTVLASPSSLAAPTVQTGPRMPSEAGPYQRTMPTSPGQSGLPARSTAGLFLGVGAATLVAAAAIAAGVWMFAIRGRDAVAPIPRDAGASPALVASAVGTGVAVPDAPKPEKSCPAGMTPIPGGKFFMGSDDKKDEEQERPAHQVTLSPFCMDTHEVTVAEYKGCSDRGECKRGPTENDWPGIGKREHKIYDPLCNIRDPEALAQHPINCIDWELASAYCVAQGKRLPTEAEWEFATRGSDGRKYPWGDDPPKKGGHLNACGKECVAWGRKVGEEVAAMYPTDDGFANTAPVGSFPKGASPFGLQDVVGNVWEWVGDWYAGYGAGPENDPRGAETGTERVLRGGAWNGSDTAWVRPTYRFKSRPTLRSHGVGMRCAKSRTE